MEKIERMIQWSNDTMKKWMNDIMEERMMQWEK